MKLHLKMEILGMAAVLATTLGGKGEPLENWLSAMDDDRPPAATAPPARRKSKLSPAAIAFFSGLPQKS